MSTALEVIAGIAGTAAASAALLSVDRRLRVAAMAVAIGFAGGLVIGQAWDDQLSSVRDRPAEVAALLLAAPTAIGALAWLLRRHPLLLPLALLAVLPFRIPVDAGSETSYLLIPLYFVIAAGVASEAYDAWRGPARPLPALEGAARWLALALAAALVLYALQAAYSSDTSLAAQNIAFFLIPFAVMFALLRGVKWDSRLIRGALLVVAAEALVLSLIGIVQHEARHIFWNDKAMESNEFDLEFRVNSLFWDPNIYARYLALAIVLMTGALLWVENAKRFAFGALAVAAVFAGMAFAFSQTGYFALLAGLVILCALRWSVKWTAIGAAALVAAAAIVILADRGSVEVDRGRSASNIDETTSGRSRLVSGGFDLFKEHPAEGHGSGSFVAEFAKRNQLSDEEAAVSHTEPVTIAAEQGIAGVLVYLAVVAASVFVLLAGFRTVAPGFGGTAPPDAPAAAAIAIAAAYGGLLIHTLGYAGFLTDPLTWALLAVGSALARHNVRPPPLRVRGPRRS